VCIYRPWKVLAYLTPNAKPFSEDRLSSTQVPSARTLQVPTNDFQMTCS
jgi:hypothetical protein